MPGKIAYSLLLEHNICPTCLTRTVIPGKKACAQCVEYRKKYYKRIIAPGKCWNCRTTPADKGHVTCTKCRTERREYQETARFIKEEATNEL